MIYHLLIDFWANFEKKKTELYIFCKNITCLIYFSKKVQHLKCHFQLNFINFIKTNEILSKTAILIHFWIKKKLVKNSYFWSIVKNSISLKIHFIIFSVTMNQNMWNNTEIFVKSVKFLINIQNFYTMGQFSQKAPDGIFWNPLNYNMGGVP